MIKYEMPLLIQSTKHLDICSAFLRHHMPKPEFKKF